MIDKVEQRHKQFICNGSKPNSILIFIEKKKLLAAYNIQIVHTLVQSILFFRILFILCLMFLSNRYMRCIWCLFHRNIDHKKKRLTKKLDFIINNRLI